MSNNSNYLTVYIIEKVKNSIFGGSGTREHVVSYTVRTIKNNSEYLIGEPIDHSINRVRVEKTDGIVKMYNCSDNRIMINELDSISDKTPEWLDEFKEK